MFSGCVDFFSPSRGRTFLCTIFIMCCHDSNYYSLTIKHRSHKLYYCPVILGIHTTILQQHSGRQTAVCLSLYSTVSTPGGKWPHMALEDGGTSPSGLERVYLPTLTYRKLWVSKNLLSVWDVSCLCLHWLLQEPHDARLSCSLQELTLKVVWASYHFILPDSRL